MILMAALVVAIRFTFWSFPILLLVVVLLSALLYAGNVGLTGPIDPPATDVIGLKSVPKGEVTDVDAAVETAAALGNNGRVGGMDAPDTGGCIPGGIPGIPGIIL